MSLSTLTLDFESYFDDVYSLSKGHTTESYIRHPKFEAHGCAIKASPAVPAVWFLRDQLPQVFASIDWSNTAVLAHNAAFDGLILSHHYNVRPKFWFDTLPCGRLLLGNHLSVSLANLSKHFNLEAKNVPYDLFKGRRWHELSPAVQQQVGAGACHDVELTFQLFQILGRDMPAEEFETIDITTKMFTTPCLRGDVNLFADIWEKESLKKQNLLAALNLTEADLQSSDRFVQLLCDEGVEVEFKNGKNKSIPAIARTDDFMKGLLEHDNDIVRALAEARLGVRSTITQTRAETFGRLASCRSGYTHGTMPVNLKTYGAHTTRWSGTDGNWQNLPRNSDLRRAILPPEGFLAATPDESQVEARLLNTLAGQQDKIEDFRNGRDPYVGVASEFFGFEVNKNDHPTERQVGKVLELQAGYGSGAEKIRNTLRLGGINISSEQALRARDAYRETHPKVVALWSHANMVIKRMANWLSFDWGPMRVHCDVNLGQRRIILPNGCPLLYDTLEWFADPENDESYWRLKTRHGWSKLYGAKLVENVCQALARVIISQAMIRISRLGYRIVNTEHDSLWLAIPKDGREQEHLNICMAEMKKSPPWMPDLPLDCEGLLSERYAK